MAKNQRRSNVRTGAKEPTTSAPTLPPRLVSSRDAARRLGVSLPTLYAYVSRGKVRTEPAPEDRRRRLYLREDLERLIEQRKQSKNPSRAAASALHYGMPVLRSALTNIAQGRLYYRGRDAIELARTAHFEEVVGLLWDGPVSPRGTGRRGCLSVSAAHVALPAYARMQTALAALAAADPEPHRFDAPAVRAAGSTILHTLTDAIIGAAANGRPARRRTAEYIAKRSAEHIAEHIAEHLAAAWSAGGDPAAIARSIDACLIACADHEFNVSSFTARCVASARAPIYDVVQAGLAALRGARHGGHTTRVARLLDATPEPGDIKNAVLAQISKTGAVPGFGHPLYPDGDPRAQLLLELARAGIPRVPGAHGIPASAVLPAVQIAELWIEAVRGETGAHPTVDLGLVVLARSLHLPEDAPFLLFALGRAAGWIAHALEQYGDPRLIRPRARYVGPPAPTSPGSSRRVPSS